LALKRKKAFEVGIEVQVVQLPEMSTTEEVVSAIQRASMQTDGIIVQLPFPAQIDITAVLDGIPTALDVDAMHYDGTEDMILPPVVGAIKEIAKQHDVLFATQEVVVVGKGLLVGAPASIWCKKQGAKVVVVDKSTEDIETYIKKADILILGAGKPGLIVPAMIKDGVCIFDAGTSGEGGVLKGDADIACANKASLFTPVPGGIGPITIAILLRNLIILARAQ
jgi:methylenetetrahydrofolate dehydrogenase (NADP+)/methenyltetrahydrofolate cyclohydrolase